MTLRLRVQWNNPSHFLLANPRIAVSADGGAINRASMGSGFEEFVIPDQASGVLIHARFLVSLPAMVARERTFSPASPNTAPVEEFFDDPRPAMVDQEVLSIIQAFTVLPGGTALRPNSITAYAGAHPLLDVKSGASVNGASLVQLRTDFVDITALWMNYAANKDDYLDHKPGTRLVVLGHTGGHPLIWFASVPSACIAPPRPGIGALVFFRPSNYTYSSDRLDEPHDMYPLNRYLLAPDPTTRFPDCTRLDTISAFIRSGNLRPFGDVRAGFEAALSQSGKAVVMLHPWPSAANFGSAATGALPGLVRGAIRFLWASSRVGANRGGIDLGRLGLSAFSAGGAGLWPAFAGSGAKVKELYLLDVNGVTAVAPQVIKWAHTTPGARLRMSAGHNDSFASHLGIKKAVEDALALGPAPPAGGLPNQVSASPLAASGWDPGGNLRWDHALSLLKTATPPADGVERANPHTRHQFALFGGSDPGRLGASAATFLQEFLLASGYDP